MLTESFEPPLGPGEQWEYHPDGSRQRSHLARQAGPVGPLSIAAAELWSDSLHRRRYQQQQGLCFATGFSMLENQAFEADDGWLYSLTGGLHLSSVQDEAWALGMIPIGVPPEGSSETSGGRSPRPRPPVTLPYTGTGLEIRLAFLVDAITFLHSFIHICSYKWYFPI